MKNRSNNHRAKKSPIKRSGVQSFTEDAVLVAQRTHRFSGPIPDPKTLAEYQAVDPEAVKWILNAGDEERAHRHKMEEKLLSSVTAETSRGQICAFLVTIAFLGCAAYGRYLGQKWAKKCLY